MKNKISGVLILLFVLALVLALPVWAADYRTGDMNGDGNISSNDAIYLLRHVLMPQSYPVSQPTDMNGDGKTTADDAILLLRHSIAPGLYKINCVHNLVQHEALPPTCTSDGWNAYESCARCGYTTQTVLAASGHNIVGGVCTLCGQGESRPTVAVTSLEAAPGDTGIEVAVSVRGNPGMTGMMLTLQYNAEVFRLTGARNGSTLSSMAYTPPGALGDGCTFLWDAVEVRDEDIKDGDILILTFDISPNAIEGTYDIFPKIRAYDNDMTQFAYVVEGGNVTIKNN